MNKYELTKVIIEPRLSEKTTGAQEEQKIVFTVRKDATKLEIKQAVEEIFGKTVLAVNTVQCKGKNKRFGRYMGKRKDFKKAYITLAEGSFDVEAEVASKQTDEIVNKIAE